MKKTMPTLSQPSPARTPTTEMEVTSIRLERDLKDKLKQFAGRQGYQALIRDILWDYVQQQETTQEPCLSLSDIRATMPATAQHDEHCALSGDRISPHESMLLGWTAAGALVPISLKSIPKQNGTVSS